MRRSLLLTVASLATVATVSAGLPTAASDTTISRERAGSLAVHPDPHSLVVVPAPLPGDATGTDEPAGESGSPPPGAVDPTPPPGPRDLVIAPGHSEVVGDGPTVRFIVEVEEGTGVDPSRFADSVEAIIFHARGWTGRDGISMQRVDDEPADLRITLAFPDTVDRLCRPLDTRGAYSCWNHPRALINLSRWLHGAETYGDDIANYRRYLISHEVGHGLGHGHRECPGDGEAAPVMLQQTIDLDGCERNPWPQGSP